MTSPRALIDLRKDFGLRSETPVDVYEPLCALFFEEGDTDLARIRAVARDAGAAGWLHRGVSLGGLATRIDGLRRREKHRPNAAFARVPHGST